MQILDDVFECQVVLVSAGDQLVADLLQHTLFLVVADLDLLVADEGAGALLGVQDAEQLQVRVGLADGVGVDLKLHGEVPHRGQLLAGQQPLGGDAVTDLIDDLPVERHAALEIQLKLNHSTTPD